MIDIITDVDKLCDRSDEIDTRKENALMREIILALKNGIKQHNLKALAAPQVGYNRRIFCIKFGKSDIRTFINPMIAKAEGLTLSRETCPSLPGRIFIRPRNNKIEVMYQTPLGKIMSQTFLGAAATVFQEMVDHLDGMLLSDVSLEIDEAYDKASEEERAEVLNAYLESLDIQQKEAEKAIEEDPEAKQMSDAIKFMESVVKGETKLGEPLVVENTRAKKQ